MSSEKKVLSNIGIGAGVVGAAILGYKLFQRRIIRGRYSELPGTEQGLLETELTTLGNKFQLSQEDFATIQQFYSDQEANQEFAFNKILPILSRKYGKTSTEISDQIFYQSRKSGKTLNEAATDFLEGKTTQFPLLISGDEIPIYENFIKTQDLESNAYKALIPLIQQRTVLSEQEILTRIETTAESKRNYDAYNLLIGSLEGDFQDIPLFA